VAEEYAISHTTSQQALMRASSDKSVRFYKKLIKNLSGTKKARKRSVRYGFVFGNIALLSIVTIFIISSTQSSSDPQSQAVTLANGDSSIAGPLDQLSSVDIAVNIARSVDIPESTAVTNQSDSANIATEVAVADTAVVTKPQVVATNAKSSGDIVAYTVLAGDTIASVAAKFNVTSESIRWSNNLTGNTLQPGVQISVPPLNGVVYTVGSSDTPESLAARFNVSKEQIIAFNDAEISGLRPGARIVIPGGQVQTVVNSTATARSFKASYGYNTYDPGWCTYYAAAKSGAPGGWGNANTWAKYARITPGWNVSSQPVPGAIAQTTRGGLGHVAIVDAVKEEGGVTYIKYSDMNGLAGFNRVGYSDWVPANGKYQNFIYR
jgi:N-acetylmuramoyl-L-alanine amidase